MLKRFLLNNKNLPLWLAAFSTAQAAILLSLARSLEHLKDRGVGPDSMTAWLVVTAMCCAMALAAAAVLSPFAWYYTSSRRILLRGVGMGRGGGRNIMV